MSFVRLAKIPIFLLLMNPAIGFSAPTQESLGQDQALEAASIQRAKAFCEKIFECRSPYRVKESYGYSDVMACEAHQLGLLRETLTIKHLDPQSLTSSQFLKCAKATRELTCLAAKYMFRSSMIPDCQIFGNLSDEESCDDSKQCKSGYCKKLVSKLIFHGDGTSEEIQFHDPGKCMIYPFADQTPFEDDVFDPETGHLKEISTHLPRPKNLDPSLAYVRTVAFDLGTQNVGEACLMHGDCKQPMGDFALCYSGKCKLSIKKSGEECTVKEEWNWQSLEEFNKGGAICNYEQYGLSCYDPCTEDLGHYWRADSGDYYDSRTDTSITEAEYKAMERVCRSKPENHPICLNEDQLGKNADEGELCGFDAALGRTVDCSYSKNLYCRTSSVTRGERSSSQSYQIALDLQESSEDVCVKVTYKLGDSCDEGEASVFGGSVCGTGSICDAKLNICVPGNFHKEL